MRWEPKYGAAWTVRRPVVTPGVPEEPKDEEPPKKRGGKVTAIFNHGKRDRAFRS